MEKLQNLSAINTNTIEGRLLIAAMAKISGLESFKEPDVILQECHELAEEIYKDVTLPHETAPKSFVTELQKIINCYSKENESDTPDFILAGYLNGCLELYNKTIKSRDDWFGVDMWGGNKLKDNLEEVIEPDTSLR